MRFRCPSCQRAYRLSSADRIHAGITARIECPGCRTTLLLSRVSVDNLDLHVSAVASPPAATAFFGEPAAPAAPVPPMMVWPPAMPLAARDVAAVPGPDYERMLQEFSVLFRLHNHKRRSRQLLFAGALAAALGVLGGGLWLGLDTATRSELLAALIGAEPAHEVSTAVQVSQVARPPVEASAPLQWPGLAEVEGALQRVPAAPHPLVLAMAELQAHELATPAKDAVAPQPAAPVVQPRPVDPVASPSPTARARPRSQVARLQNRPSVLNKPYRLSSTGNALSDLLPPVEETAFDLLEPTHTELHRSAGPSAPPPPKP